MEVSLLGIAGGAITILLTLLVAQFKGLRVDFRADLKDIGDSVKELNVQIAQIVTDQTWHKEELKELKEGMTSDRKSLASFRERLHTLEGRESTMLSFIEEYSRNKQ
tara:strand:+ start:79 stop:399 length:321 start_codon:yes stop_codon:yes gene_type:complete